MNLVAVALSRARMQLLRRLRLLYFYFGCFVVFLALPNYYAAALVWTLLSWPLPVTVQHFGHSVITRPYQRFLLLLGRIFLGLKIYLGGDIHCLQKGEERALILSNHIWYSDFVILNYFAERCRMLGRLHWVIKSDVMYLPIVGMGLKMENVGVFIRRGIGKFAPQQMSKAFSYLKNNAIKYWFYIFPEGTFHQLAYPKTIKKSCRFCRHLGIQPFRYVLAPRLQAIQLTMRHLRESLQSVYDFTIVYDGTRGVTDDGKSDRVADPDWENILSGECSTIYVHLRRVDIADVPDEDDLQDWLLELFRRKDDILTGYYAHNLSIEQSFGVDGLVEIESDVVGSLPFLALFLASILGFYLWLPFGILVQAAVWVLAIGHVIADLMVEIALRGSAPIDIP